MRSEWQNVWNFNMTTLKYWFGRKQHISHKFLRNCCLICFIHEQSQDWTYIINKYDLTVCYAGWRETPNFNSRLSHFRVYYSQNVCCMILHPRLCVILKEEHLAITLALLAGGTRHVEMCVIFYRTNITEFTVFVLIRAEMYQISFGRKAERYFNF